MKLNWKSKVAKKLGMVAVAGTMALGMASGASGDVVSVADASFEDHNIDSHAGTVDYAYSADGGNWVDGFSPGAGGDSAWTSRESGANAAWIYNSAYATATNRSGPRTGDQAISGSSAYTYQALTETFEANTTYTFSIYSAFPGGGNRSYMYIYDATVFTDGGDDGNNLATSGSVDNFGDVDSSGVGTWQLNTLQYTTGATGAEIGNAIGISFWSPGNLYFDDVSVDKVLAVPEPSSLIFIGTMAMGLGCRRRRS